MNKNAFLRQEQSRGLLWRVCYSRNGKTSQIAHYTSLNPNRSLARPLFDPFWGRLTILALYV